MYVSTKTYGHEIGLSCAFRQWRAESHCRLIHGYALKIHLEFEACELDERNWVVDFGSLKSLKGMFEDTFDHKLIVAEDDPKLDVLKNLEAEGLAEIVILPKAGCEAFAEYVFGATETWLQSNGYAPRVRLRKVEVHEHGANSAQFVAPVYAEGLRLSKEYAPTPLIDLFKDDAKELFSDVKELFNRIGGLKKKD